MDTYGKRLESAIKWKKKSRAWLAGKIGVTVQAIGQVILGKTNALTAENHEKAVAALGCSGHWLATGEGEMIVQTTAAQAQSTGGVGTVSVTLGTPTVSANGTVCESIDVIASALAQMTDEQRAAMASKLASLAHAPDSATLKKSISDSLTTSTQRIGHEGTPDFLKR